MLTLALVLSASAVSAEAGSLWVTWDAHRNPDVTGYVVLWGTIPGLYRHRLDVGARTSVRLTGLDEERRYYITVRAYTPSVVGRIASAVSAIVGRDANGNGIPDSWEAFFRLNNAESFGATASSDDADGDGVPNAIEHKRGTHPRGTEVQYLPEGVQSQGFWDTEIALLNPGQASTNAVVVFERADGKLVTHPVRLNGRSRATVSTAAFPELQDRDFATRVESDVPLVVDRTVSWDKATAYGAHAETALSEPARRWYLTEGATSPFSLFYLIQNPDERAAEVQVTYLLEGNQPERRTYNIAPHSRKTILVNNEGARLRSTAVSGVVESLNDVPIIVERAMYLDGAGQPWAAGSASAGVTSPSSQWLFAEGAANDWFDLYYLFANPGNEALTVQGTYFLPGGGRVQRSYTVPPHQRLTVHANEDRRLANTAASARFVSADGQPFLAERSMWWPRGGWYESHTSGRITEAGTRWAIADGESGGRRNKATYVLAANTTSSNASVRLTLLFEGGGETSQRKTVAANGRSTWHIAQEFPGANGRRYGVLVESLNNMPLVVERATYWDGDRVLGAGTNAAAVRLK